MQSLTRWVPTACAVLALTAAIVAPVSAQARPATATAQCKDGSYSQAKTERGACSDHGGVATWYGVAKTEAKTAAKDSDKNAPKTAGVAPAGATAQCADGSYTKAKEQRGACSGHGGVSLWMAGVTRPAPVPPPAATSNPPATAPPTPPTSAKAGNIQAPPAGAPENATAQCNDGTFSFAREHRGACSSHKGVKAWFK